MKRFGVVLTTVLSVAIQILWYYAFGTSKSQCSDLHQPSIIHMFQVVSLAYMQSEFISARAMFFSLSMFFKVLSSEPYYFEDHVRSVEILQPFSLVNAPSLKQHRKRLISVSTRECSSFVLMVETKIISRFIAQLFCSCASVAHQR